VELEEHDFFRDPLTTAQLRGLLNGRSPSEIFSWNSPSFKKMGRTRESLSEEELLQLMLKEPRLIRRPLIVVGGRLIVGSDKQAIREAFG
jgi:arsenate reductase-like glutaredoxin family protein